MKSSRPYWPILVAALSILFHSCGNGSSSGSQTTTAAPVAQITLPTNSIVVGPTAAATGSALLNITLGSHVAWTANTTTTWIHLFDASGTTASIGSIARFAYDANSGATRTGLISFQSAGFNATLAVTQAGVGYVAAVPPLTTLSVPHPSTTVDIAGNIYSASCTSTANTLYEWVAATGSTSSFQFPGTCGNGAIDQNGNYFVLSDASILEWPLGTQQETTVWNAPTLNPVLCGLAVDLQSNVYGCYDQPGAYFTTTIFNVTNSSSAFPSFSDLGSSNFAFDASGHVYLTDEVLNGYYSILEESLTNPVATPGASYNNFDGISLLPGGCPALDGSGNVYFAAYSITKGISYGVAQWSPATGQTTWLQQISQQTCPFGDGLGNIYLLTTNSSNTQVNQTFTPVFVDTTNVSEPATAGSDHLPPVIPATTPLDATSDSPWLTITGQTNGVVSFSFTAATAPRTAHITLLGETIIVSQDSAAAVSTAHSFVPITPCRLTDTFVAGSTRDFAVTGGECGVPTNAQAYAVNVTAIPQGKLGFLTVWPAGTDRPLVSTLNSDGRTKSVAAIVPSGANGTVSIYASDATNVALDVTGYFVPAGSTQAALAFYPLTSCRVLDATENNGLYLKAGQSRSIAMQASPCSVPPSAQAYSLNFSTLPHHASGSLTAWPAGKSMPTTPALNAESRSSTANAAIIQAGVSGNINVYANQDMDLTVDINGYFAPPGEGGLSLYTMTPCRILDTRTSFLGAQVTGFRHVNALANSCSVPASARALVLNATAVTSSAATDLTIWRDREARPSPSTLGSDRATATSNMAIVPLTRGAFNTYASQPTHLILDISSYFAP